MLYRVFTDRNHREFFEGDFFTPREAYKLFKSLKRRGFSASIEKRSLTTGEIFWMLTNSEDEYVFEY